MHASKGLVLLHHPDTGEVYSATVKGADGLREQGWTDVYAADPSLAGGESGRPNKNASREAWDAYAESLGLDPDDFSSKDSLIDAVDQAGAEGDEG